MMLVFAWHNLERCWEAGEELWIEGAEFGGDGLQGFRLDRSRDIQLHKPFTLAEYGAVHASPVGRVLDVFAF